ncbi:MAG: hypothetical protein U9Q97_00380 [Acidobacteriota bacterium]|nr:hypothetical protein [Acidobacteriota bacterium]
MKRIYNFAACLFVCLCLSSHCLMFAGDGLPDIVDRIMAVVNEEVITLIDVRIVEAFGLYESDKSGRMQDIHSYILNKLINQKLILQLASENNSIEKQEVDSYLNDVIEKIGQDEMKKILVFFSIDLDDLRQYLRENLFFKKIISAKFSRAVSVSLREIEEYYHQVYIHSQEEKGLEPKPMVEILDEIESAIKQKRMNKQVEEWILNLRKKANVQINFKVGDKIFPMHQHSE